MQMPTFFNLRGYISPDPLDKAPNFMPYLLLIIVNALLTVLLIFLNSYGHFITYNKIYIFNHEFPSLVGMVLQVLLNCIVFSPLIILLRKSSSFINYIIILIPYLVMDIYFESHFRYKVCCSSYPLWNYCDDSFLSLIKVPILKFIIALSSDAILCGIIGLYLTRLIAMLIYRKKDYHKPSKVEYNNLFSKDVSDEIVKKPKHDLAFWLLKLLGIIYLIYLAILIIGKIGSNSWPDKIKQLIDMTYLNPALAINTYAKISLMIFLTILGAYNKKLRFHSCLALFIGHITSTIFSFLFYFINSINNPNRDFLLYSAIVDLVMSLIFLWIMFKFKNDSKKFKPEKDFPIYFSIPMTLMRSFFTLISILFFLIVILIVVLRFTTQGDTGLAAIFGYPDPLISNTLTLYVTLTLVSFLLISRDRLRQYFYPILLFPLISGAIISLIWVTIGSINSTVLFATRVNPTNPVFFADWYFILHAFTCLLVAFFMIILRKMYYNIDYGITSISPSAAINIIALTGVFFGGDSKQHSSILKSIDQYVGGITGRKRGLLNLPFGLLEYIITPLIGLRPHFSSMETDEQLYFLRRYIFRNEVERDNAIVPFIANFSYKIGLSLNALVMFATYSNLNVRNKIGFVPVDARDRTQGDFAEFPPPFKKIAKLPKDENDSLNFKPLNLEGLRQVAPRVTTPVREDDIPNEVDYLIIGSGAGGATAAYKLACKVNDPSKILIVERGNRYQPLQDFEDSEIDMMKKIYKEGGLQQTKKFTMSILQGECVGGSTISNNAVCYEMPGIILNKWQDYYDIDLKSISEHYKIIAQELDIKKLGENGINQNVKKIFENAISLYNSSAPSGDQLIEDFPVRVNHLNNIGDGNWNLGNKRMRKRSMLETYIPWSEARGVKIVSNMTAVRFISDSKNKKAKYVILRDDNGELKKIKINKAVIVAGGVIASSHFLMRSEVRNNNIGKRLSCNLAVPLLFDFDEELKAYDGEQITLAALDPKLRAVFETYFNPPSALALSSVPFYFNKREKIMERYKYLLNFGALIGSEPNGVILKKADILNGQAFNWKLGNHDTANIKYAINTLIKLGMLGESKRVILPFKPGIELNLKNLTQVDKFIKALHNFPLRIEDLIMATAHPQGGNLMAGYNSENKDLRVVNENFQLDGYDNVFVVDASLFPISITVNPQWTIMALSSMAIENIVKICP
jgi:hypothetical protein